MRAAAIQTQAYWLNAKLRQKLRQAYLMRRFARRKKVSEAPRSLQRVVALEVASRRSGICRRDLRRQTPIAAEVARRPPRQEWRVRRPCLYLCLCPCLWLGPASPSQAHHSLQAC
jgi:hypothetical protein